MTTARTKHTTWALERAALANTMRLAMVRSYHIESVYEGARVTEQRKAGRAGQSVEERKVTLIVDMGSAWERKGAQRHLRITSVLGATALDNLSRIQRAFETIRLTAVRDLSSVVVLLYRQLYPAQSQQQQTPPPPHVSSSGPYAVLHIANGAPLEVAEAAYRVLAKSAHPDAGGAHAQMIALNAAIEDIRKRAARVREGH